MIVVLGAGWCSPCKTLKKALDLLKVQYSYVDVDSAPGIADQHSVSSLPTILFDNGARYEGCPPIRVLNQLLAEHGVSTSGLA